MTFKVYAAPAPNRHTSANSNALNAYNTWVGRAMDSIENSKGSIGSSASDPAAFVVLGNAVPRQYMVTANYSWRARANPTGSFFQQQGNRLHFVVHIKGNGTVRFKYEDIGWEYWSNANAFSAKRTFSASPPSGWTAAYDRVDCTHGWGYDWGADRTKGGADDVKVCGGDRNNRGSYDSTLVDELFYAGPGFALTSDSRYNNPTNYPEFVDYTLQGVLGWYCNAINGLASIKSIGMKFNVVGSDNNTYTYTKEMPNPEFGLALNPNTCAPYPPDATEEPAPQPTGAPTATAIQHTGPVLQAAGYNISAAHGLTSGVQFKKVEGAEIGISWVLDLGVVDAIDVWGYAEQGVTVCFPQAEAIGGLLFLDASASPRTVTTLESFMRDGQVCATIYGEGTIVAVGGGAATPVPESAVANTTTLTNCMVKTLYELNFRETPGGKLIGSGIPYNATLTALERTADWFKVDYHGVQGWISAQYVQKIGDCG